MTENQLSPTEVMSLAKGFYNLHKASEYFRAVKSSPNVAPAARGFITNILNRIGQTLVEMKSKLGTEGLRAFHQEISNGDTIQFDAVFDEMIMMSSEQRELMEQMAKAIRKGEIQFVNPNIDADAIPGN